MGMYLVHVKIFEQNFEQKYCTLIHEQVSYILNIDVSQHDSIVYEYFTMKLDFNSSKNYRLSVNWNKLFIYLF